MSVIQIPRVNPRFIRNGASVPVEELQWLWYGWVPVNGVTLVYGDGGAGKSQFMAYLAKHMTTGQPFPNDDESMDAGPKRVLIVGFEDHWGSVTRPRLEAAGAKVELVDFTPLPETGDTPLASITPAAEKEIAAYLEQYAGEVGFLAFDHLTDMCPSGRDLNNRADVAEIYSVLRRLGSKAGIPVILVHHSKKGFEAGNRAASNSKAITDMARSAIRVFKPDPGGREVCIVQQKANYGDAEPLAFEIDKFDVRNGYAPLAWDSDRKRGTTICLRYVGVTDKRPEDAQAREASAGKHDPLDAVIDWLEESGGWATAEQVKDKLIAQGIGATSRNVRGYLRKLEKDQDIEAEPDPDYQGRGRKPMRYRFSRE